MKLYHGTTPTTWKQIEVEGLKASGFGIVYLTPLIEEARGYGGVVLEVETGNLRLSAFDDCREWETLCWGAIPPEQVCLLEE